MNFWLELSVIPATVEVHWKLSEVSLSTSSFLERIWINAS